MIYTGYTQTDSYYEFVGDEGKLIVPSKDVLLVDDESGLISIKNTASRCTVGLLKKSSTPPTPTFEGKWLATYADSSTTSAECDASSAITENEITLTNLVSIEIGDCVTSIGDWAFSSCYSLTSCTIGSGVTSIGEGAFYQCTGLTSIDIPNSVTSIDTWAFQDCYSLTGISIPDSVTSIGQRAFYGCSSITSIDIPDSVTSVEGNAFYRCSGLTTCTIGSGVTSIGSQAFRDCSSLTSITVNATTPPTLGILAFYGTSNDLVIYVPAASVSAYQSAWSDYSSRIQAIP